MRASRRPGGLVAHARKLWALFSISLASRFAYPGEVLARSVSLALVLFAFTQLWRVTARTTRLDTATGLSLTQLVWYLAFAQAFVTSASSAVQSEVEREIRTGELAYRLVRPIGYPAFQAATQLGERLVRFATSWAVGCAVAMVVARPCPVGLLGIALALGAVLLAALADWIWSFAISVLSFWIEDTSGVHLLYRRSLLLLGGGLVPLTAYPAWLGKVAARLPFRYVIEGPAQLLVAPSVQRAVALAGNLALVGGVGLIPLVALYGVGLRRLSVNGG